MSPRAPRPLAEPPVGSGLKPVMGDPGPPLIGSTWQFIRQGPALTLSGYERFGPVSWSRILGMPMVAVAGPEACQAVLTNRDKAFSQSGWEWFIGPFFHGGLMLLDGEEHHLHRRIMQEAFTRPRLEAYVEQVGRITDTQVARWPADRPFRLYPAVKELSLRVAAAVFMGVDPDRADPEIDRVARAFVDCVRAGLALVRRDVPGSRWHRGLRGRAALEDWFRSRIAAKRASDDRDLFAALCHARSDGDGFSDAAVVDHMIFLMMAAHDTSSITATATCYFLATHPEWQERCRQESLAIGPGPVDLAATERLASLDLVVEESLRLVTPVPGMARRTVRDTDVLGHYVPAGTMVNVASWATHLLPDLWPAPGEFRPERFEEPHPRFASIPFGGGVHKCIGMHFGRAEVKALVHRVLVDRRVEVEPGYRVTWDMTSLPSPADGLPVVLRPLHSAASSPDKECV